MRKFFIVALALVLCLSAFFTGCGKKDSGFTTPDTQSRIDHAQAIKDAMFGGGTMVEEALAEAVTVEIVDEQEGQLTVALTAPQIYDRIANWYGLTAPEGQTQQALEQEVFIAVEEAVQEEDFETIEIVIEYIDIPETGPVYVIPEEGKNHASGGMDRFFDNYDYDYPPCGFVDSNNIGNGLDLETIEHQMLIQTLEITYYDAFNYAQVDIDCDGTKELLMFMEDPSGYLPGGTHMTFDTDTESLWVYSSLGAAEYAGFKLVEGQWMFNDNYGSAGNMMTDYRTWADNDGWVSECYYQAHYEDSVQNIVIDECTWFGQNVTEDEFFAHTATPVNYANPDLHMQVAYGSYENMVETLDKHLTDSYYHDVYLMQRGDVNGDGMEDCVFLTGGTYEKRVISMNLENVWGDEAFFDVSDDANIFTVIALVQTPSGAIASVSRIWPNATDDVYLSDDGALMFGNTPYVYDNAGHFFGEYIAPEDMPSDDNYHIDDTAGGSNSSIALLDLLEMPVSDAIEHLDSYGFYGPTLIEGSFQGESISMLTHNDIITTITVPQSGMMDIDSDTNMSMTAVNLWENIDHTVTPWNPIEMLQGEYGHRLYYTHPQSGNPYIIDLYYDSVGKDANLTRIEIMVQF